MEYICVASPKSGEEFSEDAHLVVPSRGEMPFLAVVIDTHHRGTHNRAQAHRVAKVLVDGFREGFGSGRSDKMIAGLDVADRLLLYDHPDFGAVVTGVEIFGDVMRVAQLGDTCMYASAWNERGFELLTTPHTAGDVSELRRMEPFLASGYFQVRVEVTDGVVHHRLYRKSWFGWKRCGIIPTRALGDKLFRPALTPDPEVFELDLTKMAPRTLYVLCSDGAQRAVERVFARVRGRASMISLKEVSAIAQQGLSFHHDDDATMIFFRCT